MFQAKARLAAPLAAALVAALLLPVAAQASDGVCLGRKLTAASGTADRDGLAGTADRDVLAGLGGDDALDGGTGDDRLCGGTGNDVVAGGDGNDVMRGNGGDDVLIGGPGSDTYIGGPGSDVCELGPGDRALSGCELTLEDDTDGDGLPNGAEVIAGSNPNRKDAGRVVDVAVLDDDSDQIRNEADNCRDAANLEQSDLDADGEGDACDPDADGDRVEDAADNCLDMPNLQSDQDRDGAGDECDDDLDGDQIPNAKDLCPTRMHGDPAYGGCPPLQPGDADGDGVLDNVDNCQRLANPGQLDRDGNAIGDLCEDPDGDGVTAWDNCPSTANPAQTDGDGDGIGDACGIPPFQQWLQQFVDANPFVVFVCANIGFDLCMWLFQMLYDSIYNGGVLVLP